MESTDSSTGTQQQPNLPPGFRFHPTDEELVVHYLKRKAASAPIPVAIIADIDLYKFDPWELPAKAIFGEHEWYFFSPRDRKYPNGARPNRAATSGYWKATGTDKPVLTANGTQKVGVKKALVFYGGRPPRGIKTNWIMHEYRLAENKATNKPPPGYDIAKKENSLRLDDWVLCRIYKKNNSNRIHDHDKEDSTEDMFGPILPSMHIGHQNASISQQKATNFPSMFENDQTNMFDGMLNNATTMSQIASTSSKAVLPLVSPAANPTSTANNLPLRRTLSSLCWNDEDVTAPSQNKRFHEDNAAGSCSVTRIDNADNNSSLATLFSQVPQTSAPMQQGMVGPLGDGVLRSTFQLSGMNWYS